MYSVDRSNYTAALWSDSGCKITPNYGHGYFSSAIADKIIVYIRNLITIDSI